MGVQTDYRRLDIPKYVKETRTEQGNTVKYYLSRKKSWGESIRFRVVRLVTIVPFWMRRNKA